MVKINENLKYIESENSFAKVIKLANVYKQKHPDKDVVSLGKFTLLVVTYWLSGINLIIKNNPLVYDDTLLEDDCISYVPNKHPTSSWIAEIEFGDLLSELYGLLKAIV